MDNGLFLMTESVTKFNLFGRKGDDFMTNVEKKKYLTAVKVARDLFWKIYKDSDTDFIGELLKDMSDEELVVLDLVRNNK